MASFTGGDKLQAKLADIAAKLDAGGVLRAGFLEGATYPDGTSVPMVAAIHEFGAPGAGIPARPYFRPTIARHSAEWGKVLSEQLKADDYDAEAALGRVGMVIQGEIRAAIAAVTSPSLKPETVKRKGFEKPLIDTNVMMSRVDYEVNV